MELLALAERVRAMLEQLLREEGRASLMHAFGPPYTRLTCLCSIFRALPLSGEHAADSRLADLERSCCVIRAVLQDMDAKRFREWLDLQSESSSSPVTSDGGDSARALPTAKVGGHLVATASLRVTEVDDMQNHRHGGWYSAQDTSHGHHRRKTSNVLRGTAGHLGTALTVTTQLVPQSTDSECSTAASSVILPVCGSVAGDRCLPREHVVVPCSQLVASAPLAGRSEDKKTSRNEIQQTGTQWFNLSLVAESDGDFELEREEDRSWLLQGKSWRQASSEQLGAEQQPLIARFVDFGTYNSVANNPSPEAFSSEQALDCPPDRWKGVLGDGASTLLLSGVNRASNLTEAPLPRDSGNSMARLARARHKACVEYVLRVAERADDLEEENLRLRSSRERLLTENKELMQKVQHYQKCCVLSDSCKLEPLEEMSHPDGRCRLLEVSLTAGTSPPAHTVVADGSSKTCTSAGVPKAEIWLDTASCEEPSVSCEEPSGFITKTNGTTQACKGSALQWDVWPRQLRVVGAVPGGLLERLAVMQCVRDHEARQARAAASIQESAPAHLLQHGRNAHHVAHGQTGEVCAEPVYSSPSAGADTANSSCSVPYVKLDLQCLLQQLSHPATFVGGQPVPRPLIGAWSSPARSTAQSTSRPPVPGCTVQDTSRAKRMPPWAPSQRQLSDAAARHAGSRQPPASPDSASSSRDAAVSAAPGSQLLQRAHRVPPLVLVRASCSPATAPESETFSRGEAKAALAPDVTQVAVHAGGWARPSAGAVCGQQECREHDEDALPAGPPAAGLVRGRFVLVSANALTFGE